MKIEEIKAKLTERKDLLENLKTLGDNACSFYDLMMGYDAEYYLRSGLIENQIKYYQYQLEELTRNGIQTSLF